MKNCYFNFKILNILKDTCKISDLIFDLYATHSFLLASATTVYQVFGFEYSFNILALTVWLRVYHYQESLKSAFVAIIRP